MSTMSTQWETPPQYLSAITHVLTVSVSIMQSIIIIIIIMHNHYQLSSNTFYSYILKIIFLNITE